jgi:hypothetical protein
MTTAEIVSNIVALVALVLSVATLYKTFLARFNGKAWSSTRLVLTHLDTIPCIGLVCFLENLGAKPGNLDDLRLRVKHDGTGAIYYFFPHLMRDGYSIYMSYQEKDWFPFSGIPLSDNNRVEKYVLFKPLNDKFSAEKGSYEVILESRWYGKLQWIGNSPSLRFSLTNEVSKQWNDPTKPAIQVLSSGLLEGRKFFD